MIKFKVYEYDTTLMSTYTDLPEEKKLHKISTDEYYDFEAIDVIKGFYGPEEPELEGLPYCDYVYEEVDKDDLSEKADSMQELEDDI